MKKHLLRVAKLALRTLVLTFLTSILAAISRAIFVENTFEQEYFTENGMNVCYVIIFLLIINSFIIAFNQNDKIARVRFLETMKNNRFTENVKYVVKSVDFYVELALLTFGIVYFPTSIFVGFELENKFDLYFIVVPIVYVFDFWARINVQRNWYIDTIREKSSKKKKVSRTPPIIKSVAMVIYVYCGLSIVVPWLIPIFITFWNIGKGMFYVWLLIALIVLGILIFARMYLRAVFKRRSFIKKLEKYCADNSVSISKIKKPYGSIMNLADGYNFRIEKDGKKYDCKFVACLFTNSPVVFTDKGDAMREIRFNVFRIEVFKFVTKFDFGFESEGKKIIILLPVPRIFLVSTDGSKPRLADVAEVVGGYTFYTGTGFLNALGRDCL